MTSANGTVDMSAGVFGMEEGEAIDTGRERVDWFAPYPSPEEIRAGQSPEAISSRTLERIAKYEAEYEPIMPENEEPENIYEEEEKFMESESCFNGSNSSNDKNEDDEILEIPANTVACSRLTREGSQLLIKHYANELHCMCLWGAEGGNHGPNDYEYRQCPCECTSYNSPREETLGFPGVFDNIEGKWLVPDCPLNTPDGCECATTFAWQQLADNPYVPTHILRHVATSLCQHLNYNEGLAEERRSWIDD